MSAFTVASRSVSRSREVPRIDFTLPSEEADAWRPCALVYAYHAQELTAETAKPASMTKTTSSLHALGLRGRRSFR
jgi:hypothetical protein